MDSNPRRRRPTTCKECGATAQHATISFRGLCEECAASHVAVSIREMTAGAGPTHDKWREAQLRALLGDQSETA